MFNKTKPAAKPRGQQSRSRHCPTCRRPARPAPDAIDAPRRPPMPSRSPAQGLSTLSADLTFEGNVSGAGDLQLDGAVKGDVRVGRLIVGETGAVEGNVSADYVEVRGRIVGAVIGKQVKLLRHRLCRRRHHPRAAVHRGRRLLPGPLHPGPPRRRAARRRAPRLDLVRARRTGFDARSSAMTPSSRSRPRPRPDRERGAADQSSAASPRVVAHPRGQGRAHEGVQVAVQHALRCRRSPRSVRRSLTIW